MTRLLQHKTPENTHLISSDYIYEDQINLHCFDVFMFFIATLDPAGNIAFLNKRAKEVLGSTDNELIGENFVNKLVIKEDQRKIKSIFKKIIQEKTPEAGTTQYQIVNQNKQRRIIDAKNVRIIDHNENLKGILVTGKDMTEYVIHQKNLQKDIHLHHALLNNLPGINFFVFDREMRFLLAEGTEMGNFGMTSSGFKGKTLFEISNNEITNLWTPLFQKVINGEKIRKEYKIGNSNYLIRVSPLIKSDEGFVSGIAVTRNITGEKLTKKILNKSREEAIKAEKAKSQFLANMSHEIRTPLNAIMGFAEQLLQSKLSNRQKEYVEILNRSSEHLLAIINDVLVLSKIEANQIIFDNRPFSLKAVLEYVYKSILIKAEEKNLSFTFEISENPDRILIGDSFRLQQILINLLTNAVKFTNSGSVKLSCTSENETMEEVSIRFDVMDTGIGISSKDMKKIFKQYTHIGSGAGKVYEGTGLGLSICKNLVKLQNGSLHVSSKKGVGSTFSFTIPYKKGKKTDLVPLLSATIHPDKLKNKKVLLVDDDKVNLMLGKAILQNFKCSFDMAENGKEAITKLDAKKYDVILLDIHMPDISGLEVAKYLRNIKKDKESKIIAVTAVALKDNISKYHKAGINDYLIKPYREIYLFNKICEVLQIKSQQTSKPRTEIILKSELSPKSYNLFDLNNMANNDPNFIIQVLKTFIENSETAVLNFKHSLEKENWKEIGEIAHKILPSFKHLEVNKIIPKLVEIETKTLISNDTDGVAELVRNTIYEIDNVLKDIKKETGNIKDFYY